VFQNHNFAFNTIHDSTKVPNASTQGCARQSKAVVATCTVGAIGEALQIQ